MLSGECSLAGLVREVGRRLFNCTVTCEVLERSEDIQKVIEGVAGHSFKEYVMFQLHIKENDVESTEGEETVSSNTLSADTAGLFDAISAFSGVKTGQNCTSLNLFKAIMPFKICRGVIKHPFFPFFRGYCF